MPAGAIYVSVAAAATVSSAFTLPRADRPVVVFCASNGTAASVQVQFALASGTPPFVTPARVDGSGLPYAVFSGTGDGLGILPAPPTPWGRISLGAAPSSVVTFTILETLG